jgi:hypothetical protein
MMAPARTGTVGRAQASRDGEFAQSTFVGLLRDAPR